MKSVILAMAVAIVSRSVNALPAAAAGLLPHVNLTLADWGIVQVEDLGLLHGDVVEPLDKRFQTAYAFQAFYGDHCDTGAGSLIQYAATGTGCDKTDDRHSFRITGGRAYVSADPNSGCPARDGGGAPGGFAVPGCYNVNTGMPWRSSFSYYSP